MSVSSSCPQCSGTEPCDRCLSKKRVCTFSSVQNQRKVTRSLKDLRAERTIGSPCRSPVAAGPRGLPDSGSHCPYIRVGSGIVRRHSPNELPNPAVFRRSDTGPLMNVNGRPVQSSQPSGSGGWPYEWEAAQVPQDGGHGGLRRVHQPQPIGIQNQLHYLQPHQQHYLNSPALDMTQSPLSAGGHFYSAQSSPTFFQNAGQTATPAMNAFGPTVQGGAGLGPAYSNAHYYAGIGQGDLAAHGMSSLQLQQQQFQPRMTTQSHIGDSSGSGSDDMSSQQGWRDPQSLLTVGTGGSQAGGQNMFSVGNEQLSQQSQIPSAHGDAHRDAPSNEGASATQQSSAAEESVQLQSRPSSAGAGDVANGSSLSLPELPNDASSSIALEDLQGGNHSEPSVKEEIKLGSPSGTQFTSGDPSVHQGQSATEY